ncbi:hypothetical protein DSC45_35205 [Streptomyces sp. YIM 130001]|uniref:hypothetical protein n=1 Tax=Streptomyces sp. YIM 130001 TaxID=2259644 RepID=UPI000EBAEF71|nr:hypothetical protein [Streptomyces sp. YIM 130001]RII06868.1 hypothetical protein DSC45_35205 [Streptomyces sp. YIM 130001]
MKLMVQTLAAACELQRELTYDGLRAADAKGAKGGRRPAVAATTAADVRTAYLEGCSIADLAREHQVSRGAIRTAVADLLPEHTATEEDAPAPELPVTLDVPGKFADYLRTSELEPAERAALDQGRPYGASGLHPARQRHPRRTSPAPRPLCQPLDGGQGAPAVPAQRKARREYENGSRRSRPEHDRSQRQPL